MNSIQHVKSEKLSGTNHGIIMKNSTTLAVMAAALLLGSGCVESDPTLLMTGHVYADCDEEGACEAATFEGEKLFAGVVQVNLAEIQGSGQVIVSYIEEDEETGAETLVEVRRPPGSFTVNFVGQNQLVSTTEYTSVGYDSELRNDQNQFQIERFEFEVTDSPAGVSLGDVPYTGFTTTGGEIFAGGVPMLGPLELQAWAPAITGLAGNNSIVPATVEAKAVGQLVDGTNAESNTVTLELLICNGCSMQSTSYGVITN